MSCVTLFIKPFKALYQILVWKERLNQQVHKSLPRLRREWWGHHQKEGRWLRITFCSHYLLPRPSPQDHTLPLPQMETSYSNLSFRRKLQRGKQNWLGQPRSKRAKDLTSSKPWTSPAHCNVLAKWHSHGRQDSWLYHSNHQKSPGKDWKGELYQFWVQTTPLFLDK